MRKQKKIDELISAFETDLELADPTSEDYDKLLKGYERLIALRDNKPQGRVDINTLLMVGGNLAGIVAILAFEQRGIITSKALSFIMKPKLK